MSTFDEIKAGLNEAVEYEKGNLKASTKTLCDFTQKETQKENMTIRIDPELKAQATALFEELGMDLSTATEIFYRQALRCNGLPFAVRVGEPNDVTYAAMEAAEKGQDMFGPFVSTADLMEALDT